MEIQGFQAGWYLCNKEKEALIFFPLILNSPCGLNILFMVLFFFIYFYISGDFKMIITMLCIKKSPITLLHYKRYASDRSS